MSEKEKSKSPVSCPNCEEPIPDDAPGGICPKCALAEAAAPVSHPTLPTTGARFDPPSTETLAKSFPQLEILELIGCGGMGAVYLARQPNLDRPVALKILSPALAESPSFTERFSREGRLLARLNHPNIVGVHDFGESDGYFFLIMEYVDGVNLRQAMRAGRFTPEQALEIVPAICEALQFAHDEGVLHRDIKPENILLDEKGRVKIADFGIAKLLGDPAPDAFSLTGTSMPGTPQYMAPEQIEHPGDVDHRADIFSLGVVFYEMLTGELPMGRFAAPSEKTAVDSQIDEIVFRALEKERERRQQSAREVKTDIQGVSVENLARMRHAGYVIPTNWKSIPKNSDGKRAAKTVIASIVVLVVFVIAGNLAVNADSAREAQWRERQQIGLKEAELEKANLYQEIERLEDKLATDLSVSEREEVLNQISDTKTSIEIADLELRQKYQQSSRVHAAHDWNSRLIFISIVLLTAAFAIPGTIMGWRSLQNIRVFRLEERRRISLFAALLWPLITSTAVVFLLTAWPMSKGPNWVGGLGVSIALVLSIAVGWLVVKGVLKWIETPSTESERSRALAKRQRATSSNPWWGRIVVLLFFIFFPPFLAYATAFAGGSPGFFEIVIIGVGGLLLFMWFRPFVRKLGGSPGSDSRVAFVDTENPWPKRIFWLLFCFLVLPVILILIGLVVPYLSLRQSPPSSDSVPPIEYSIDGASEQPEKR